MSTLDTSAGTREFLFEDHHFDMLRKLARQQAGIELNDSKRELVYGRLARRLRELRLTNFDDYCRLLQDPSGRETSDFVNAITTNHTAFFREEHHFEFLRDEALPALMKKRAAAKRIRIWCAAASTGQEPYTLAITSHAVLGSAPGWDYKILATDIDSTAIAKCNAGVYRESDIPEVTGYGSRRDWFRPGGSGLSVEMSDHLRQLLYFRELNLMNDWPMTGPIDIIFCRNVVIYFSKETQRELFKRFAKLIAPDGYLFIGHSESILHSTDLFEPVGRTIYRPIGAT
jgi:chemotaxis protein methyltransferase CheR